MTRPGKAAAIWEYFSRSGRVTERIGKKPANPGTGAHAGVTFKTAIKQLGGQAC
jgi:hypothetical protein